MNKAVETINRIEQYAIDKGIYSGSSQHAQNQITDNELAREVMTGWSGITDADGVVPYSEAARDQLLDIPLVSASIVMALFSSIAGAKRKN